MKVGFKSPSKANFLDKKPIIAAVGKAKASALARDGGYVTTIAKRSIKKAAAGKLRKVAIAREVYNRARTPATRQVALEVLIEMQKAASAPAGKPPRSVKGFLKDHLFFSWDSSSRSVVAGPEALGAAVAPRALEEGGKSVTKIRRNGKTITREITIAPHPYMGPALAKATPKLSAMWADSVKP